MVNYLLKFKTLRSNCHILASFILKVEGFATLVDLKVEGFATLVGSKVEGFATLVPKGGRICYFCI